MVQGRRSGPGSFQCWHCVVTHVNFLALSVQLPPTLPPPREERRGPAGSCDRGSTSMVAADNRGALSQFLLPPPLLHAGGGGLYLPGHRADNKPGRWKIPSVPSGTLPRHPGWQQCQMGEQELRVQGPAKVVPPLLGGFPSPSSATQTETAQVGRQWMKGGGDLAAS